MAWRFAGRAEDRIDVVVIENARHWGIDTAARYNRLVLEAMRACRPVGFVPACVGFGLT
jgi:hypothetical protein